jgi:hypothetical protein
MTLKNRTISPVVQVFLDYVREAVKPFLDGNNAENRSQTRIGATSNGDPGALTTRRSRDQVERLLAEL